MGDAAILHSRHGILTCGLYPSPRCALQKRFLIQGRLYIFANHVCFYANVFGYVKILVRA